MIFLGIINADVYFSRYCKKYLYIVVYNIVYSSSSIIYIVINIVKDNLKKSVEKFNISDFFNKYFYLRKYKFSNEYIRQHIF